MLHLSKDIHALRLIRPSGGNRQIGSRQRKAVDSSHTNAYKGLSQSFSHGQIRQNPVQNQGQCSLSGIKLEVFSLFDSKTHPQQSTYLTSPPRFPSYQNCEVFSHTTDPCTTCGGIRSAMVAWPCVAGVAVFIPGATSGLRLALVRGRRRKWQSVLAFRLKNLSVGI